MAENGHARSSDEPEECGDWRCDEEEWDGDDDEEGIELRGSDAVVAELEITAVELANSPHASCDEEDEEEQSPVCEERVDAEHQEDNKVVTAEVAEVPVDAGLAFCKVDWL